MATDPVAAANRPTVGSRRAVPRSTTVREAQDARRNRHSGRSRRKRLRLLDGFELVSEGVPVPLPMSAQRVLAFVALHERPLQRPYVAGSLWLDSPQERAHANLRSALWRVHRCGLGVVRAVGQQLALDPGVVVDVRESEAWARCALDANTPIPALEASAFTGDLLPDWYEDWVSLRRECHRQLRLQALDALCERFMHEGRLRDALEVGLAAVASEPLRETAHRAVVLVHLTQGNVGEAIRHYRLCRRILNEQLGIEPSRRMEQLVCAFEVAKRVR